MMKRTPLLTGLVGLFTAAMVVIPATSAGATSARITRVNAPGISNGVLYVDNGGYCHPAGSTRPGAPAGTAQGWDYDASGQVITPGVGPTNTVGCGGPSSVVRVEAYPVPYGANDCTGWDPFTSPSGGAHLQVANGGNIGTINMPSALTGGIKPAGKIFRSGGVSTNCNPNQPFGVKQTSGVLVTLFQGDGFTNGQQGAFGEFYANHGNDITLGWVFPGAYSIFIDDRSTGNAIRAEVSLDGNSRFDVDMDATCFGFDNCQYTSGGPTSTGGGFHPVTPARILDTRTKVGIANGRVRAGDGSLPNEPNPFVRYDEADNHQTKVTGVGGVPEHGVSAVLLNVTVSEPDQTSWLAVYPKLPHTDVFYDQSWFRTEPGTSNLNFKAKESLPNLVLARVGAGGKVMLQNFGGTTEVIADVMGWFDTGTGGDRFTGVTPDRILDTRQPNQGGGFGAKEVRHLKVTGRSGVPADATAVVLNVTQIGATAFGYMTIWPSGVAQPDTSNLNGAPGRTRPNLVVSKIGANGSVDLFNFDGSAQVAVDVVGYYSARGGFTYSVNPARVMDSRNDPRKQFGPGEVRDVTVVGVGGVPANATAVIVNVTGTGSNTGSFLTVYPKGAALPTTSNVNMDISDAAPNLVMMKIGAGGQISISNDRGSVHVIVDVMGYVV